MKEQGIVIKINRGTAVIEITPHEKCSKCCSCGAGRKRNVTLPAGKLEHLMTGDKVEIEIDSSKMLKIYTYLYGMPLAVFISIILAVHSITGSPIISFGAALIGTVASFFVINAFLKGKEEYSPKVRKIIE